MEYNKRDIFIACSIGDLQWLTKCISGVSASITALYNHEGLTPLHIAAQHKYNNILEYILDHCTDVNVNVPSLVEGDTPLHYAAAEDECSTVILLLDRGADSNIINKKGQTPLHVAAEHGHTEVVHLLLLNGAKDSLTDIKNHTPLDLSKLNGHYKCTRMLHALHWARLKDFTAMTNLHVQKTLREQLRVQQDVQRKVKEQQNGVAYKEWLSSKKVTKIEIPEKCSQRNKDKVTSGKSSCQTCNNKGLSNDQIRKRKNREGHKPLGGSISKIEISLNQADHNTHGIGKPDQLYPYSNYPPRQYRGRNSKKSVKPTTRTNSRASGSNRVSEQHRPVSVRSMPTPRVMNTPSPIPPSYSEYSIHQQDNNIHELNKDHYDNTEQEEVDLECGEGSSSSIDGLTFHEVGPENNLRSLVTDNSTTSSDHGRSPFSLAAEILQMLRMTHKDSNRLHRRHSTGSGRYTSSHRHSDRGIFNRTISLNAIPEGEVVTTYETPSDQGTGSRVFDEKLLATLMPYAFNGNQVEDKPDVMDNQQCDEIATIMDNQNDHKQTLKLVTVAWDDQVQSVKILVEEQKLSPRDTTTRSPTPSPTATVLSKPVKSEGTRTLPARNSCKDKQSEGHNTAVLKIKEYKFGRQLNLIQRK